MGTVFLLIFTVSRAELCLLYFLLIVYSIEDLLNWTLCLSLQCAVFPLFFLLMYKMYNNLIVGFSWENLQYISPLLYSLSLWSIDLSIAILVEVWQGSFDFHIIISFFFRLTWKKLSPVQYLRRVVVVPDSRYSVNLEKGFIVPLQYYRI